MARIAQIISTARYLPEREMLNEELTARFAALGRPHVIDKLAGSTGIKRRFYAPENWVTSDLALAAAKEALKRAGRKPEDVDLVMVGTTSPDYVARRTRRSFSRTRSAPRMRAPSTSIAPARPFRRSWLSPPDCWQRTRR
jgi:3-oxoacyl-[acyl-carrier-protein] synthase III